jgi:hypothetical protein
MAGVKISQLQDGGALQSTDAFPVARGSLTRKILGADLLTKFAELDTKINQVSSDAMIIDNYELSAMPAFSVKSNPTNTTAKPIDVEATLGDTVLVRPLTGNIQFGKITAEMFTGVLPISSGGTGQSTANAAINALLPTQTGNSGKVLTTNGTNTYWQTAISAINVFDSPTIDLNWNASTRTLSAVTTAGVALSSVVDAKFIPKPASASAQQVLTYNGSTATWVASAAGGATITLGTPQTANSQYVNFTGIPSGTKQITVNLAAVQSQSGVTSRKQIQLGTSAGYVASGYIGTSYGLADGTTNLATNTGIVYDFSGSSASTINGIVTLTLVNPTTNQWSFISNTARSDAQYAGHLAGSITLPGALTSLRIGSANASNPSFSSGTINIAYMQ